MSRFCYARHSCCPHLCAIIFHQKRNWAPSQSITDGANDTITFYAKGLSRSAVSMTFDDGDIEISIADDIRNLVSSTQKVAADLLPTAVSPNPTTGRFQVAFEKSDARDWTFDLYNPLGQLALQQSIGGSSGSTQAELQLAARSPGLHHFLLRNGEGVVVGSGKVLVQ
ncbi:MAG: hypothetical protein KF852_12145 [Saprospiraceae bacterium]|nr:hypothetical protein [Saprospiraceae bacterium]